MKKIKHAFTFFLVCFLIGAFVGCGGENVDQLPCLTCEETVISSSSSYALGSSSSLSVSSYAYCIKNGFCLEGPYTLSECVDIIKGSPSNSCVLAPSSSSSSSSEAEEPPLSSSSSSVPPSSSSSVPSSSSSVPSSSSSVPSSSSSVLPSSSSLGGGYTGSYGSLPYEGQTYKTVVIGTQTWMAENLNYAVEGSKCYDNDPANCDTYGSLYDWATAMALPSSCNSSICSSQIQSKHRGICPSGWHIPNDDDWNILMVYVGGSSTAGRYLKSTSGWYNNGNGTDQYGFSALPRGNGNSVGNFSYVGDVGRWWSASEYYSYVAYYRRMYYDDDDVYWGYDSKPFLFSVRCLQD